MGVARSSQVLNAATNAFALPVTTDTVSQPSNANTGDIVYIGTQSPKPNPAKRQSRNKTPLEFKASRFNQSGSRLNNKSLGDISTPSTE
eukprot:15324387-Ditylum_brightwellii.AAC.1